MLAVTDIFRDIPAISAPSLVLCGADDPVSPEPVCRSVQPTLTGSAFHLLPEVGHYAALENPALFNGVLEDFLTSTGDRP